MDTIISRAVLRFFRYEYIKHKGYIGNDDVFAIKSIQLARLIDGTFNAHIFRTEDEPVQVTRVSWSWNIFDVFDRLFEMKPRKYITRRKKVKEEV